MKRLALALVLLTAAFPAAAAVIKAHLGSAALAVLNWLTVDHPAIGFTAAAVVLLLRTVSGPAGRTVTALVGARVARVLIGGAR